MTSNSVEDNLEHTHVCSRLYMIANWPLILVNIFVQSMQVAETVAGHMMSQHMKSLVAGYK